MVWLLMALLLGGVGILVVKAAKYVIRRLGDGR